MTNDELALLRHIEAYPDDDLPRLVYADWLDEQGRHTRAEFIRVQCELATIERRLSTMSPDEKRIQGPRRGKLQHVVKSLLRTEPIGSLGLPPMDWQEDTSHWRDWGNQFAGGYVRGFASHVYLRTQDEQFPALLRLCKSMIPVPFVAVVHEEYTSAYTKALAHFQLQERWLDVGELVMYYFDDSLNSPMAFPHELMPMTTPVYSSLRDFRADNCKLTSEHLRVLCEQLTAPRLKSVSFRHNRITDIGVGYLGSAKFADTLRQIDLSHNPLSRPDISTLVWANFPALEVIDLRGCRIAPEVLGRMREALPGVAVECD